MPEPLHPCTFERTPSAASVSGLLSLRSRAAAWRSAWFSASCSRRRSVPCRLHSLTRAAELAELGVGVHSGVATGVPPGVPPACTPQSTSSSSSTSSNGSPFTRAPLAPSTPRGCRHGGVAVAIRPSSEARGPTRASSERAKPVGPKV
eukprot:5737633-Prymnesium_polylepis.2